MDAPRPNVTDGDEVWLEPVSWDDRRGLRRADAALAATLARPDRPPVEALLLDISPGGCRVAVGALRSGDRVSLHLSAQEPVRATVAWATATEAGLEFRTPLRPELMDRLAGG